MPAFNCPECHALTLADHEATYYWCECGQPLTAANAAPGMADGVADETPSSPVPAAASEKTMDVAVPQPEAPDTESAPAEVEAEAQKQRA